MKLILGLSSGFELIIRNSNIKLEELEEMMMGSAILKEGNTIVRSDCIEYAIFSNGTRKYN